MSFEHGSSSHRSQMYHHLHVKQIIISRQVHAVIANFTISVQNDHPHPKGTSWQKQHVAHTSSLQVSLTQDTASKMMNQSTSLFHFLLIQQVLCVPPKAKNHRVCGLEITMAKRSNNLMTKEAQRLLRPRVVILNI
jgi:hypothetical protein